MRRLPFQPVPRDGVERFGPGEEPTRYLAGDFILTHGEAWTSKLIRLGQRLRIHGADRKYTHWNHAALIVSDGGDLIEALGAGVTTTHISKYTPKESHLVRIGATADDRKQAVDFARWAAGLSDSPRQRYGFITIASITYTLLTGGKFTFAIEGQAICSGLVARAMERTGAIFNRTPTHVMPADLAKYYDVEPPPPPAPASRRPRRSTGQEGTTHTATPALIMAGAVAVLLVVVLVAAVELDDEGVRGTVFGAGLGILNLALGYLVMRRALRQGMKAGLITVGGGMIARLVVLAGLMILFQRTGVADPAAFALTFLVFFFVYLGLEVLLVERSLD